MGRVAKHHRLPIGEDPLGDLIPTLPPVGLSEPNAPAPGNESPESLSPPVATPAMPAMPATPASEPVATPSVPASAVEPAPTVASPPGRESARSEPKPSHESEPLSEAVRPVGREKLTIQLEAALIDEMRDIVYALSGPPAQMTLAKFAAEAFAARIALLRDEHCDGAEFPRRAGTLRVGPPAR